MPTVTSMADAKAEADGLTSLDRVDVQLDSKRAGAFCHSVRHHKQKRYSASALLVKVQKKGGQKRQGDGKDCHRT